MTATVQNQAVTWTNREEANNTGYSGFTYDGRRLAGWRKSPGVSGKQLRYRPIGFSIELGGIETRR
jgi:hypothetical protein